VRQHFGESVLRTAVPRSVRLSEAPSYGQSIHTYDPSSPGALCYLDVARDIATRGAPAVQSAPAAADSQPVESQQEPSSGPTPSGDEQ
jgi:hypothetical protein